MIRFDAALTANDWIAIGTCATALIALAAGIVALIQVRQAKALREEQARPYVVAFMEPSKAWSQAMQIVVQNFGKTAAYDVRLNASPTIMRCGGANPLELEPVALFERLSVLVPGERWFTLWETGPRRAKFNVAHPSDPFPSRHSVRVSYRNYRGKEYREDLEFNWAPHEGRHWITEYSEHDSAKALGEIKDILKKWAQRDS